MLTSPFSLYTKPVTINKPNRQLELVLRELKTREEYQACTELQKHTWGDDFSDLVPATILMITQKVGGITAGAFDANGDLISFVYGLTGVKDGSLIHWSHMLATREEYRGLGIGRELKIFQKELLSTLGVKIIYWTYDPLVARNAHLNMNHLGVQIGEYIPNMYRDDLGGKLHRGIPLDRFIVAWHIQEKKRISNIDPDDVNNIPIINSKIENGSSLPFLQVLRLFPRVRIEIPFDIQEIKSSSLETAAEWRQTTREAFLWYLNNRYEVTAFYRDPDSNRCFYVLEKGRKA